MHIDFSIRKSFERVKSILFFKFLFFFVFYTFIYNLASKYFLQLNNRILSILLFKIVLFFSISKLYLKNENNIDN